ncbi:MAG: ABC transporter ATP-binding protein [Gammaproteobacteria bacterium]|nr:ABC transporter ATP-binding protein [Gammaproteobacteria bacterium]
MQSVPALSFEGLCKSYGATRVLDRLSFQVERGEAFALVGANGAGKTTCIRALLDFTALDAGEIRVFGQPHAHASARARLAFLPERFNPPHYLRGLEFIRYVLTLHGSAFDRGKAVEMATRLDLDPEALGRPLRGYSKGMAQKIGLSACLLCDSDLLVLDEPMSGLDPKARLLVKAELKRVLAAGRSLFFSTHLLADVEELCDRVGVIHAGHMHYLGAPAALRSRYATEQGQLPSLEEAYLRCLAPPMHPSARGVDA